jgi:outer membrane protein assembly factor BamB
MTATHYAMFRAGWLCLPCALLATAWAAAGDWPQFLGPQRNGISDETGLVNEFPVAGPRVEWRIHPGEGMSGLAVVDGVIYTLVQHDGGQFALALDAANGETIWETQLAPEYKNPMGDGPRATPAVTKEAAYFFTGEGILAALSRDGSRQWSHNVVKDQQGKVADYGMACSPLIVGDSVIVTIGAPSATVVAYDRAGGKLSWKAGRDIAAGYSSPALLKVGDAEQLVAFAGSAALGISPDDGKLLWNYPFETDFNCNIATPVSVNGGVFISSGENHGSTLLSVTVEGGVPTVKEGWSSLGPRAVLHNEWQTSLLLDGHLYGFDNIGSAGPTTHLTCIDAATGERKWQQLRFGKGNMIAADGKLWITTMGGDLVIVRATPERFEELDRAALFTSTRQAPALCNGRLYLRTDDEILSVDVRAMP